MLAPRRAAGKPGNGHCCSGVRPFQEQTMETPDYNAHFSAYAAAYERSLGERVDSAAIRAFFAEGFVAAGTNGQATAGANDDSFEAMLQQGYRFYKAIGTRSMKVTRVQASGLYENHDSVQVFYKAGYQKKDGSDLTIEFDVLYILQRRQDGAKIIAFVTGDEMALYKQHGLVDDLGQPVM
jgi:hypothetical protein